MLTTMKKRFGDRFFRRIIDKYWKGKQGSTRPSHGRAARDVRVYGSAEVVKTELRRLSTSNRSEATSISLLQHISPLSFDRLCGYMKIDALLISSGRRNRSRHRRWNTVPRSHNVFC